MKGNAGRIYVAALRAARRGIIGWTLGAAAVALSYLSFYPTVSDEQWQQMMSMFPREVMQVFGMADMSDGVAYANATVYALLGTVIVLIFALTFGSRLIGGEEETGTIELEYAAPATRGQVYVGRLAALWTGIVAATLGLSLTVAGMNVAADMGIKASNVWLTGIGFLALTGAFGTIAFAVGAATGRRSSGLGVAATLAVLAYLANVLGPIADARWLTRLSPFDWFLGSDPLRAGPSWSGLAWLALLAAVPAIAGWLVLRRRDLMV